MLGACFIDRRMAGEDAWLKWALDDGEMGRRMDRRNRCRTVDAVGGRWRRKALWETAGCEVKG